MNTSSNGAEDRRCAPPQPQTRSTSRRPFATGHESRPTRRATRGLCSGPPLPGDRVADVMLHYQQVMQQFLETQRAVMLCYLGAARERRRHRQRLRRRGVRFRRFPWAWSRPPSRRRRRRRHRPRRRAPTADRAPLRSALGNGHLAPAEVAAQTSAPPAAPEVAAQTAAPAAAPEAAAGPPSGGRCQRRQALTREQIEERLLAIVSERTGYPVDMLELDADLEGDLGIDSIKRVEIAGTFTQSLGEQERAAIDLEELTASRTLTAVIDDARGRNRDSRRRRRRRRPEATRALLSKGRPRRSASAGSSCRQRALPRSAPPPGWPAPARW